MIKEKRHSTQTRGIYVTDVHAHMSDPEFDADRLRVLERARASGVEAIISVSETLTDAKKNIELAETYPELLPAAGLYPTHLDFGQAEAMCAFIRRERSRLVAIGEVGLDYWAVSTEEDRECQRLIFKSFIDLSAELDLPLNVHSRSAGREAVEILLERGASRVVLHAFDAKSSSALKAVEEGYFFSIPPSVIRSRQKQKLVRALPLSCLLVETDSPVLGPVPYERNEPANASIVLDSIAELKNLKRAEVAEAVFDNTGRLCGRRPKN